MIFTTESVRIFCYVTSKSEGAHKISNTSCRIYGQNRAQASIYCSPLWQEYRFNVKNLMDRVGFEPTTTYVSSVRTISRGMQGRYSTGLNYRPMALCKIYHNLSVLGMRSTSILISMACKPAPAWMF